MACNKRRGVLFVCLGNICRSPMAEAIFEQMLFERNLTGKWFCDSAGTTRYHLHDAPDDRALRLLQEAGLKMTHKARQICKEDYDKFDFILGMDNINLNEIKSKAPANCKARIELLGTYDPEGKTIIKDPYYGGHEDFVECFQHCHRCCKAFLDQFEGPQQQK